MAVGSELLPGHGQFALRVIVLELQLESLFRCLIDPLKLIRKICHHTHTTSQIKVGCGFDHPHFHSRTQGDGAAQAGMVSDPGLREGSHGEICTDS